MQLLKVCLLLAISFAAATYVLGEPLFLKRGLKRCRWGGCGAVEVPVYRQAPPQPVYAAPAPAPQPIIITQSQNTNVQTNKRAPAPKADECEDDC